MLAGAISAMVESVSLPPWHCRLDPLSPGCSARNKAKVNQPTDRPAVGFEMAGVACDACRGHIQVSPSHKRAPACRLATTMQRPKSVALLFLRLLSSVGLLGFR